MKPLSITLELEGSAKVKTRIGGTVSHIGMYLKMLPLAALT